MGYAPSMKSQVFGKRTTAETEAEIAQATGADAILKSLCADLPPWPKRPQLPEIQYQNETSPGGHGHSGALH